jgi:orotidine-5'-phosphate decarboxylase
MYLLAPYVQYHGYASRLDKMDYTNNWLNTLKSRIDRYGHRICVGLDPLYEQIPFKGSIESGLVNHFVEILDYMHKKGCIPVCVKPNCAYFEQYGLSGIQALYTLVSELKQRELPILLDAKRGDIGATSKAYARAVFESLNVDAVTIAPYMGKDSVEPFIKYCEQGKGVYILVRTSNPGAQDLQDLKVNNTPIYLKTAEMVKKYHCDGVGIVAGATWMEEFENLQNFFSDNAKPVPFLIPGAGTQGGDTKTLGENLKNTAVPHVVNSSSGICFAWKKKGLSAEKFAEAAVDAFNDLKASLLV